MKIIPSPRDVDWWLWLLTVLLLGFGLAGHSSACSGALGLTFARFLVAWKSRRQLRDLPVQIRLGYAVLLLVGFRHGLGLVFALPAVGTVALLFFGYCPMARCLSLLPWNRREPLTLSLVGRTFLTPPQVGRTQTTGRTHLRDFNDCEREARIASAPRAPALARPSSVSNLNRPFHPTLTTHVPNHRS